MLDGNIWDPVTWQERWENDGFFSIIIDWAHAKVMRPDCTGSLIQSVRSKPSQMSCCDVIWCAVLGVCLWLNDQVSKCRYNLIEHINITIHVCLGVCDLWLGRYEWSSGQSCSHLWMYRGHSRGQDNSQMTILTIYALIWICICIWV